MGRVDVDIERPKSDRGVMRESYLISSTEREMVRHPMIPAAAPMDMMV